MTTCTDIHRLPLHGATSAHERLLRVALAKSVCRKSARVGVDRTSGDRELERAGVCVRAEGLVRNE